MRYPNAFIKLSASSKKFAFICLPLTNRALSELKPYTTFQFSICCKINLLCLLVFWCFQIAPQTLESSPPIAPSFLPVLQDTSITLGLVSFLSKHQTILRFTLSPKSMLCSGVGSPICIIPGSPCPPIINVFILP